jgi:SynChlorMet cassette radical SAM/SPASM protein ScmE
LLDSKGPASQKVMHSPRSVDVEITSRCNLRCRYCYYFDNPAVVYSDLPTGEWLRFFDELGRCSVMDVTLQGGEPFMRQDLPELIEGIVANRMRFSILSNGMLIDDNISKFIAETGRCNSVQVSVDGSSPEIHDACRGKGSFEGAIQGIHTLKRHKVPVAVRVTITNQNCNDLENIARLLIEDIGLNGFGTNSAGYLGTCRQNVDDVMLTTSQRQFAMEALLALSQKYNGRISATAGPLAEARYWSQMEAARAENRPPFPVGGYLRGCGCYNNKMAVRSDGAMIPCCMLSHMEMGRINQSSLIRVWQHSPVLSQLRRRFDIPMTEFYFCKACQYMPYCTGNCPGLSYTLTGEVNHPSPDACLRRFLMDGGSIDKVKKLINGNHNSMNVTNSD